MTIASHGLLGTAPTRRSRFWSLGIGLGLLKPIVSAVDCAIIVGASLVGGSGYQLIAVGATGDLMPYAGLGFVGSLAYALVAHRGKIYELQGVLRGRQDYGWIATGWLWAVLVIAVVLFLLKTGAATSRGSMVSFAVLGGVGLISWRALVKRQLRTAIDSGTIQGRPVILLGTNEELGDFTSRDLLVRYGLEDIFRVQLPDICTNPVMHAAALTKVLEHTRTGRAKEIILALRWGDHAQLEAVLDWLRLTPMPVRLLPERSVSSILKNRDWVDHELPMIDVQRPPLTVAERVCKGAFDFSVAALTLACLMPLMAFLALAIRIESPGPAIFRQRRNGFNGTEFIIYKFRTMTVMEDGATLAQARRSDARVTRIGRILRVTSIDELPQLYNVLRGDMSLVGPRPHALAHDREYGRMIANYAYRNHVKPGITGWAQVNGFRGGTPHLDQMAKRIELDLWYINNWALALDLQILLRTAFVLMTGSRNAY
jgi:undecaprenyl-phosphate galactose phosphotransferase/putative colanic acid biosynthesis UDP-glucose lipid carrier transferase